MYDRDIEVYVVGIHRKGGEWIDQVTWNEANIAQMKAWTAEGR